jgi:hypothetical protein
MKNFMLVGLIFLALVVGCASGPETETPAASALTNAASSDHFYKIAKNGLDDSRIVFYTVKGEGIELVSEKMVKGLWEQNPSFGSVAVELHTDPDKTTHRVVIRGPEKNLTSEDKVLGITQREGVFHLCPTSGKEWSLFVPLLGSSHAEWFVLRVNGVNYACVPEGTEVTEDIVIE